MAPSNNFPVGYKFHPRDEELVEYYLYSQVRGAPFRDEHAIPEIDLYGSMEARDIWNNNGGQNLEKDEDLYFFTKLKPASAKGTGSCIARTIGSGTWKGENSGTKVEDPKTGKTIGSLKRFQLYRNTKFRQESGCWIMHEFSLDPKLVRHIKSSSTSRQNNDEYVICRIRKNYDRKRKADDRDHNREEATRVVQSKRNKIQRLSENIDESYVAPMSSEVNIDHYNQQQQQTNINATSTSSSIAVTNVDQPKYSYHEPAQYYEVINQYDIPLQQEQTTTTIDHANVTNLPTGLTEQQRYFVTQERTVASSSLAMPDNQEQQMHLPQHYHDTQEPMTPMTAMARPFDFIAEAACLSTLTQPNSIADPTMASSLGMARQEDHLQHNGFVNNASTDMPQYY
ncbi:NAC domain-containing protein 83-like [Pyrus communis]|uniref:NAC domain-containing protein 83-like n=1 Tax=Pyrus communis TaxID=23211 RepID=UPI0035C11514